MTSRYNARIAECRGDEFGYMEGDELEYAFKVIYTADNTFEWVTCARMKPTSPGPCF